MGEPRLQNRTVMPAIYCLDIYNVGVDIGSEVDDDFERICLPFINVQLQIGDEFPTTWPPDVLRNAADGTPLLSPDGTPLFVAG